MLSHQAALAHCGWCAGEGCLQMSTRWLHADMAHAHVHVHLCLCHHTYSCLACKLPVSLGCGRSHRVPPSPAWCCKSCPHGMAKSFGHCCMRNHASPQHIWNITVSRSTMTSTMDAIMHSQGMAWVCGRVRAAHQPQAWECSSYRQPFAAVQAPETCTGPEPEPRHGTAGPVHTRTLNYTI